MIKCNACGKVYELKEVGGTNNGRNYCSDCVGEFNAECKECRGVFEKQDMKEFEKKLLCKDCFRENYFACQVCEKTYNIDNIAPSIDKNSYCYECYDKLKDTNRI